MTESSRAIVRPDEASAPSLEPSTREALALGLAVALGLLALYLGWEWGFGHLGYFAEHPITSPEMIGPRIALTVIAVAGFLIGAHAYSSSALARDIAELAPTLRCGAEERDTLVRKSTTLMRGRGAWIASFAAIPIGLLVVTSSDPSVPYLLSREPWTHDLVWALGLNTLLFAIMGRIALATFRGNQLFAHVEARLAPVDLLRPHALAPFARRGLRTAFLWIGGSSLASIVFVNQDFSWITGLVLVATLGIGTLAFVLPLRGLHRRLRSAKAAELERTRAAIERARDSLLDRDDASAEALRLPGLLAWEQRIAATAEWPFDAPQMARFALVLVLGLGSWIAGAVIDHLVEALW